MGATLGATEMSFAYPSGGLEAGSSPNGAEPASVFVKGDADHG